MARKNSKICKQHSSQRFNEHIRLVLKQLRLNAGWTQKQLGMRVGVNASFVSTYETGMYIPSLLMLKCIAKVFNKLLTYFFTEEFSFAENQELILQGCEDVRKQCKKNERLLKDLNVEKLDAQLLHETNTRVSSLADLICRKNEN